MVVHAEKETAPYIHQIFEWLYSTELEFYTLFYTQVQIGTRPQDLSEVDPHTDMTAYD